MLSYSTEMAVQAICVASIRPDSAGLITGAYSALWWQIPDELNTGHSESNTEYPSNFHYNFSVAECGTLIGA